MNSLDKLPIELKEVFKSVNHEVIWLHTAWKIYIQLFGTSNERTTLLNNSAPAFFRIVQDILFEDVILTISRLIGPNKSMGKEKSCLKQLVEIITRSNVVFASKLEGMLSCTTNISVPIREWRNKRYSHNDLNIAISMAPPLPGITRGLIDSIILNIDNIMSEITMTYINSSMLYEPLLMNTGNGDDLIKLLEIAMKNKNGGNKP